MSFGAGGLGLFRPSACCARTEVGHRLVAQELRWTCERIRKKAEPDARESKYSEKI
jgi:hypothetical protein